MLSVSRVSDFFKSDLMTGVCETLFDPVNHDYGSRWIGMTCIFRHSVEKGMNPWKNRL